MNINVPFRVPFNWPHLSVLGWKGTTRKSGHHYYYGWGFKHSLHKDEWNKWFGLTYAKTIGKDRECKVNRRKGIKNPLWKMLNKGFPDINPYPSESYTGLTLMENFIYRKVMIILTRIIKSTSNGSRKIICESVIISTLNNK